MIRLFVDQPLSADTAVAPTPDQARYLTGVMRKGVGDAILVFNGRDGEWRAEITEASKRVCVLAAREQVRPQTTGPDLELIIALVKRGRLETIVEKAAELGCRRVHLTITRHTQADHTRVDRLRAIAMEAAEQTGRLDVPEIVAPEPLDRILSDWDATRALIFCDEGGEVRPMIEAAPANPVAAILIGPEGGFSVEERTRLRALSGVTPVGLGPRILRADTAAISALTLWQVARGDWRS